MATGLLESIDRSTQLAGYNRLALLLFRLDRRQIFGINVFKVQEVIRRPPLTRMPGAHPLVAGLAEIRGRVIPVIDLRLAIGGAAQGEGGHVIVSEYNRSLQGFLVDGVERIICCGSRVLSAAERNYDTTRRELLAIVHFTHRYRIYLSGAMHVLRTDHAALKWLFHTADPIGQCARWMAQLADYPMIVLHRPGHLHANADALSRRPLLLSQGTCGDLPENTQLPDVIQRFIAAAVLAAVRTSAASRPMRNGSVIWATNRSKKPTVSLPSWLAWAKRGGPMVGVAGFEPATLWSQTRCATRLRYTPSPCGL